MKKMNKRPTTNTYQQDREIDKNQVKDDSRIRDIKRENQEL